MNVDNDLAICHECNEAFKISRLLDPQPEPQVYENAGWLSEASDSFDINKPPRGVSYENNGMGWRISSTTRNGIAFIMVPFICVWSGFSLGGIYGSQIAEGKFDPIRSLFGIPFVLGTLLFGSMALMSVFGRIVIKSSEMDHDAGSVFMGVGPIGWTRRFRWSEIRRIDETVGSGKNQSTRITLFRDSSDINFGEMFSEERRRYVIHALRQLVVSAR
ncbi:hypothetical protein C5Y96_14240 [Blastopirellula marina]|uniref:Uncharacterized protein n=2 Tax=Pirellulales TaxID=2691354 RepID=A0A2S8FEN6_9BACT|nr:hypothetical protein C5Y96_14240 [Blastopirellula marina]RCS50762.1 hypothetical protein DTL36_14250 [Bremerella cremea]